MAKTLAKPAPAQKSPVDIHAEMPEPRGPLGVASLTPISEAMGEDKSPKEILQLILKAAFSITRASSASLMLVDGDTGTLKVEVAEGFRGSRIFNTRLAIGQGVTGWVAESGVALRLGNVRKDSRYIRVRSDLRSELAVPLKIRGTIIGVISVDSTKLNHFTPEDEALLVSLAAQSARVIQTTQLYEETRQRAEELELLSEVSRGLSSTLDLRQVLAQAVEQTSRVCRATIVSAFLVGEDCRQLDMAACYGGSDQYRQQPSIPIQGSWLGRLMQAGTATVLADVHEKNNGSGFVLDAAVASLLAVPLLSKEKPLGILCVFGAKSRVFDAHDKRLIESLARSAALAIDNARAHRRMLAAEEGLRSAEKFSMLGELAAGLAHEIRNPLTSIKVLFQTMSKSGQIAAAAEQDANMIQKQILRLETIVDGFLTTARSQLTPLQLRPIELNATVDDSLLLLASSASEGTRLVSDLCPEELFTHGDATQLSQVVYNLVLNSIQAVDKRGRITLKTGRVENPENESGEIFLEVTDDGPGLPEKVQLKLFQPFVTTKKSGVGLGLSIVKRIVESHGGRLTVESPRADTGRGASFKVVLPEAAPKTAGSES